MADYDIRDIPIGKANAITRKQLSKLWNCSDREVRARIAKLREEDNGDDYIIASHSSRPGYYRTNDFETIQWFVNEQSKRARNTFIALRKARRILKASKEGGGGHEG